MICTVFFTATSSDIPCASCNKPTVRHIEVLQWPAVLIVTVNGWKKNVKHRKPPGILSLIQLSRWLAIGCPSSAVYDLICFNSVIRSSENEVMVRATKIKKSWSTNVHKRLLGEGEQLRRIFAHGRKY